MRNNKSVQRTERNDFLRVFLGVAKNIVRFLLALGLGLVRFCITSFGQYRRVRFVSLAHLWILKAHFFRSYRLNS